MATVYISLGSNVGDRAAHLRAAIAELGRFGAVRQTSPFYANEPETNTLRLSFVTVPPERIREGIAVLGKLIKDML